MLHFLTPQDVFRKLLIPDCCGGIISPVIPQKMLKTPLGSKFDPRVKYVWLRLQNEAENDGDQFEIRFADKSGNVCKGIFRAKFQEFCQTKEAYAVRCMLYFANDTKCCLYGVELRSIHINSRGGFFPLVLNDKSNSITLSKVIDFWTTMRHCGDITEKNKKVAQNTKEIGKKRTREESDSTTTLVSKDVKLDRTSPPRKQAKTLSPEIPFVFELPPLRDFYSTVVTKSVSVSTPEPVVTTTKSTVTPTIPQPLDVAKEYRKVIYVAAAKLYEREMQPGLETIIRNAIKCDPNARNVKLKITLNIEEI